MGTISVSLGPILRDGGTSVTVSLRPSIAKQKSFFRSLELCTHPEFSITNEITIDRMFFDLNFDYGGTDVTRLTVIVKFTFHVCLDRLILYYVRIRYICVIQ